MANEIQYRGGGRDDVARMLRHLLSSLAGTGVDPWGVTTGLQLRCANVLLSKIQQAFLVKARGGMDECGIKWPPLKRETIAQRRTTAAERKGAGLTKANKNRGLLTDAQNKRWKLLFARKKSLLMAKFGLGDHESSERAAAYAWFILKQEGAPTKLALFGGRQVDILRDTGKLYKSLAAGKEDQPSNAPDQVLRTFRGTITVGTNQKPWHHFGVPGRLPARPLWPVDGNSLPDAWWTAINGALTRGLVQAVTMILSRGGRIP